MDSQDPENSRFVLPSSLYNSTSPALSPRIKNQVIHLTSSNAIPEDPGIDNTISQPHYKAAIDSSSPDDDDYQPSEMESDINGPVHSLAASSSALEGTTPQHAKPLAEGKREYS